MARKESEPLERRHTLLFKGDWERLQAVFGDNIGVAKAIRTIVRRTLDNIDNKVNEKLGDENGYTPIRSRSEIIRDADEYEPESSN